MQALSQDILDAGHTLAVAALYKPRAPRKLQGARITHYLLPGLVRSRYAYDKALLGQWRWVLEDFRPDIVHIHGTEYAYGLPLAQTARDMGIPVVVSIQGLISVYARHYLAGIPEVTALFSRTLLDNLRFTGMWEGRHRFLVRAPMEAELLRTVRHVMGRTRWDYANVRAIAPGMVYHLCRESLRDPFYAGGWSLDAVERHTIFCSQATYPVKGLHLLLEALRLLRRDVPDVRLLVAGPDITGGTGWKSRLRRTGYGAYLQRLIRKYNLEDCVRFTGSLDAEGMAAHMARAHVFTLNSSIENSPNSLGEAQLVGTPCVAAFVGGVADMVRDGEDGLLYNYLEPAVLAEQLLRMFRDDALALRLSENGRCAALARHDRTENLRAVLETYEIVRANP
jgi:glycosyltransferase involved in cell wall biosynthesis